MHKKRIITTGAGLLMMLALLTVFLSPAGETVQAFNKTNLIRVAEVHEVDGEFLFRRVAPVYDFHP
ncbi:hypothetical protein [Dethiobacter alkaliphilus]|uniref:hypothetical protein n=1 Tax=Dethiobacter alkaliphilus TaxID=427926 RepID=UPI002227D692|nr:hypothetical protein [Dethiobacter alkaliphilus]MCW3491220.1 hypothetical protein [Dethiobacter alkaliphilus]